MKSKIIFIPFLLDSQNRTNSKHWTAKSQEKNKIKDKINAILSEIESVDFSKVIIHFQPVLGQETEIKKGKKVKNKTARDITNNSPSFKYFEDLVVRSDKFIKDDTNDYVVSHVCHKSIVDRSFKGHGMLIMIEEIEQDYEVAECFKTFYTELKEDNKVEVKPKRKRQAKKKIKESSDEGQKPFANSVDDVDLKSIMKKFKI